MGVRGLWEIVAPGAKPVQLDSLRGKRLAVDASIWIYQFVKAVRDADGNVVKHAHIVGFFRRICKLLFFGIKPVFVFDGSAPVLKRKTIAKRKARRDFHLEDAAKTAQKLLAVQLQRQAANKGKAKTKTSDDDKNIVYFDELSKPAEQRTSVTDAKQDNKAKPFKPMDQYHLPEVERSAVLDMNDPRLMTEQELEYYAEQFQSQLSTGLIDTSAIDFESDEFKSLPKPTQYQILNTARLRSRLRIGHTKEQLNQMLPDQMDFSRFQIDRVVQRNYLTQSIMTLVGLNQEGVAQRIAGEKGGEYVLDKNDNGWTLALKREQSVNTAQGSNEYEQAEKALEEDEDEEEEEEEWEDVPVSGSSNPNPKNESHESASNAYAISFEPTMTEQKIDIDDLFEPATHASANPTTSSTNATANRAQPATTVTTDATVKAQPTTIHTTNATANRATPDATDDDYESLIPQSSQDLPFILKGFNKLKKKTDLQPANTDGRSEREKHSPEEKNKEDPAAAAAASAWNASESSLFGADAQDDAQRTTSPDGPPGGSDENSEEDGPKAASPPPWFGSTSALGDGVGIRAHTATVEETDDQTEIENQLLAAALLESRREVAPATVSQEVQPETLVGETGPGETGEVAQAQEPEVGETGDKGQDETYDGSEDRIEEVDKALAEQEAEYDQQEEEELTSNMVREVEETHRFAQAFSGLKTDRELNKEIARLRHQNRQQQRDADGVNQEMVQECQELLQLFGIPYITAPTEAEAQCAALMQLGLVEGIVTDDSDCFLFGGTMIYKNMFNQAKWVECYDVKDLEREFNLDRGKFIRLAQLLGSDYTEGLAGVGPVSAMELLAEFDGPDGLEQFRQWWKRVQQGQDNGQEDQGSPFRRKFKKRLMAKLFLNDSFPDANVQRAYENPEVDMDPSPFEWGEPQLDGLRQYLASSTGWTWDQVNEMLVPVIREKNKQLSQQDKDRVHKHQATLDDYNLRMPGLKRVELGGSKRMYKAMQQIKRRKTAHPDGGS
uniref:ARAD1B15004p n=1 Tax=Blastobotrys adeninivorans TaxID=409370 RepID=A0A060T6D4_BLAAD